MNDELHFPNQGKREMKKERRKGERDEERSGEYTALRRLRFRGKGAEDKQRRAERPTERQSEEKRDDEEEG